MLIGNAFTRAGEPRKARAFIESELRGGRLVDGMRAMHNRLSPDGPEHFEVVLREAAGALGHARLADDRATWRSSTFPFW